MEVLDETIIDGVGMIYQVGYYVPNIDEFIDKQKGMAAFGWKVHRQTEMIRTYPGSQEEKAVFKVAVHHDYTPGLQTQLVEPLTNPNYIKILDLDPGNVCHLAVNADKFDEEDDMRVLRRMTRNIGQAIQKGKVRNGGVDTFNSSYTIYQIEGFLPVKVVRSI